MRNTEIGLLVVLAGLTSGGVAGCGDEGFECGEGTVMVDGSCLPADAACGTGTTYDAASRTCVPEDELTCGEGTIASMGECVAELDCGAGTSQMGNECVPDGSVICAGNTVFDADSGTCVVDPGACAEGTVFVVEAGECIPFDDSLEADITETTEPNDPFFSDSAMVPAFELPAVGDTTTLGGCVEPTDIDEDGFTDRDFDFFAFTATEPTTLTIRTDGVGGLAAGAVVESLSEFPYQRAVVDLTNDGAEKTIFIPRAGEYVMVVSDSRSIVPFLLGETVLPAGGPDACYFVQVTGAELPEPTATLELGTPRVGTFEDEPVVYTVDSAMEQLLFASLSELGPDDTAVDFVTIEGDLHAVAGDAYRGSLGPPFQASAESLTVVVESIFDLSLDPIGYEIELTAQDVQEYPEGGDVTLSKGADGITGFDSFEYVSFEGTAGDVARLTFDSGAGEALSTVVIPPTGSLAFPCDGCTSSDEYYVLAETGRYLFGFFNEDVTVGDDYTVSLSRSFQTPEEVAVGGSGALDLSDGDSEFFVVDATSAEWLRYGLGDAVGFTDGFVVFYDYAEPTFGILGDSIPDSDFDLADPTFDRIYLASGDRFLVQVTDDAGVDGDETATFTVEEVPFEDLGAVTEAAPVMRDDESLTAGDAVLYVVRGAEGTAVTITATGDDPVDPVLTVHDPFDATVADTFDDTGAGAEETFSGIIGAEGYLVFSVADASATGGTFDLSITAMDPLMYGVAASTVPFVADVCTSGTEVVELAGADDALSDRISLPFAFRYHGMERTNLFISSNGRVTFGDSAPAGSFPAFGAVSGNLTVFPFAADLVAEEVCTLHDTDEGRFVIQLTGRPFSFFGGDPRVVQVQLILDGASESVDVVLGPTHEVSSAEATIGVQGPGASLTTEYTDPLAAGESVTFSPL